LREKRREEAKLPAPTDEAAWQIRRKFLEEQEWKEWQIREEQMRHMQNERLQVLAAALRTRDAQEQAYLSKKVAEVKERSEKAKGAALASLERQRVKNIRTITSNRPFLEPQSQKRDLITEHANPASSSRAPPPHMGKKADKTIADYDLPLIQTYQVPHIM